jgi:phosphopantetheine--protein transferase-like protein
MRTSSIPYRGTLQLWFASVSDSTIVEERKVLDLFSDSEISRLKQISSSRKRREYLLSRALMRHALWQHFQPEADTWQFVERSGATPLISNLPEGIHFSLSHSGGLICFAIADCAVGIDIETFDRRRDFSAMAEAFMNDEELAHLKQDETIQIDYFYRTWCAKEAYFKALPAAEQTTTFLRQLSYSDLIENSTEWRLIEGKTQTCRFAAVMNSKPRSIKQSFFVSTNNWSDSFCGLEID